MRVAIITDDGEIPIKSDELSDEIEKRLPPATRIAVRGPLRKAISQIVADVKEQTVFLELRHK